VGQKTPNAFRKSETLCFINLIDLGRTMYQVVSLLQEFNEQGINFVSIKDGIDTTTIMIYDQNELDLILSNGSIKNEYIALLEIFMIELLVRQTVSKASNIGSA